MKNLFFIAVLVFSASISCRNDNFQVQNIDQILTIYVDSVGQDMLNSNIAGSYFNIQGNDVYGFTDNAPVSFNNKRDADTLNYLEYLAGAKRIPVDSVGDFKIYESKIALILTKKVNDSINAVTNDTLKIQYTSSPSLFQVSKVFYNDILKFTKTEGGSNVVKITK